MASVHASTFSVHQGCTRHAQCPPGDLLLLLELLKKNKKAGLRHPAASAPSRQEEVGASGSKELWHG